MDDAARKVRLSASGCCSASRPQLPVPYRSAWYRQALDLGHQDGPPRGAIISPMRHEPRGPKRHARLAAVVVFSLLTSASAANPAWQIGVIETGAGYRGPPVPRV